jgi:hypothetical protein
LLCLHATQATQAKSVKPWCMQAHSFNRVPDSKCWFWCKANVLINRRLEGTKLIVQCQRTVTKRITYWVQLK